ncbi:hypothetical protein C455_08717 [Haloferax larsenii JCM 13917]|nr:hypothetical protein C455_08717 [Haloferax larsenii JCM 13917]
MKLQYRMSDMALPTLSDLTRQRSAQVLLVSIGLCVCSAIFFASVSRVELLISVLRWEYLALGLLVFSAVLAARDDGLFRAWLFAFALGAGFGIHLAGIGITGGQPGPLFRIAWGSGIGLSAALVLGTLGGSLGLGVKRLATK